MRGLILAMLILLSPEVSEAAPPLENCRALSRVCTETGSRVVDGLTVRAACWRWETVWECDRADRVDQCGFLHDNSRRFSRYRGVSWVARHCRKTGQDCASHEYGLCATTEEQWACTVEQELDGRYFHYRTTDAYPQGSIYTTFERGVDEHGLTRTESTQPVLTYNNILGGREQCDRQLEGRGCQANDDGTVCLQPDKAGTISTGTTTLQHSEACWQWSLGYQCASGGFTDDCAEWRGRDDCTETGSECITTDDEGHCTHTVFDYQCGGTQSEVVTQACGSQQWCIGEDCTTAQSQPPNNSFGRAASAMNVLQEMGKDFEAFDADSVTIFRGRKESCSKLPLGLKNCCKSSGLLLDVSLSECSEGEKLLAIKRSAGQARHIRNYCSNKAFFGACLERKSEFCTFKSRLARMIQEQGRSQLGIGWGNCRGLTPEELQNIDWSQVDLSEILGDIDGRMTVPEADQLKEDLKQKVKNFYDRIVPDNTSDGDGS